VEVAVEVAVEPVEYSYFNFDKQIISGENMVIEAEVDAHLLREVAQKPPTYFARKGTDEFNTVMGALQSLGYSSVKEFQEKNRQRYNLTVDDKAGRETARVLLSELENAGKIQKEHKSFETGLAVVKSEGLMVSGGSGALSVGSKERSLGGGSGALGKTVTEKTIPGASATTLNSGEQTVSGSSSHALNSNERGLGGGSGALQKETGERTIKGTGGALEKDGQEIKLGGTGALSLKTNEIELQGGKGKKRGDNPTV